MVNSKKTKNHQLIKRNDVYIVALGTLQVFLFTHFLSFAQQIFYIVSFKKTIMYIFAGAALLSIMFIFANLSSLVFAYEESDEPTQRQTIVKVAKTSITILVLLLFVMFGSEIRF